MSPSSVLSTGPVITITVTKFVEITPGTSSPFFSEATLSISGPPHPNVKVDRHPVSNRERVRVVGRGGGAPTDLPGGILLTFQVVANGNANYQPIGISFLQYPSASVALDPNGTATFDHQNISIVNNTLQIPDRWQTRHGPDVAFEFFLLVQREDGKLGIIDPMIENDN